MHEISIETFFPFNFRFVGRREYTLITKHWQVLDHQGDQNGINSNLSRFDTCDKEASTSSNKSSADELSNDDQIKSTATATNTTTSEPNPVVYTIYGFQYSPARNLFFHILSLLLLGIPYLLIKWSHFAYQLKHRKCDLAKCDIVYSK